jgi:CIC family chloride channel protein
MSIWQRTGDLVRIRSPRHMYFYSILIGLLSGGCAVLFSYALAYAEYITFRLLAGVKISHPPGEIHVDPGWAGDIAAAATGNPFALFLLPIFGGLAVGVITRYFCAETRGAGTDDLMRAFHQREGRIQGRVPFFKALGTIFTLSTGGSGGREGPTAFIGAGLGSWVASLLKAGPRARRTLLLAGCAGGLGAIFKAPLGGALVAVEIIYKEDIESDSLVPCILASVTGYFVFTGIVGPGSMFQLGELIALNDFREILIYVLLGVVCYSVGYVYVRIFHTVGGWFARLNAPLILKPAIGGAFVGCVALVFPQAIGGGMGYLYEILNGRSPYPGAENMLWVAGMFLLIAFMKIFTTSFTIGSGGSGGVFAPSLFIGAMIGGFVAAVTAYFLPAWEISFAPFMVVGMGSFFAGVARAPFASMVMVCDIVGSYALLPPLMLVSMVAFILSHKWSLYKEQLVNRFKSPAHFWDMQLDVLNQLRIEDHFPKLRNQAIVDRTRLLGDMEEIAFDLQASDFIVVNADRKYYGMLSLKKVRLTGEAREIRGLVTIDDVADTGIMAVSPGDSLARALRVITENDVDKCAVCDAEQRVLGYIRYHDIFAVYHQYLKKPPALEPASKSNESDS